MSEREKKIVEDILTSVGLEHLAKPEQSSPDEHPGSLVKPPSRES